MTTCVPAWMVDNSALGPEAAVELTEQREFYRRALSRLPDDKREVFHMVHDLEMSLRDAADALDIPEGTVKSRLHYARRQLARNWREMETGSSEPEVELKAGRFQASSIQYPASSIHRR